MVEAPSMPYTPRDLAEIQRARMNATASTMEVFMERGCTFRSDGRSLLLRVPDDLDLEAVATWAMHHKPELLAILLAADRLEVAPYDGLHVGPLYFARWLVHRGVLSEER